MRQLSRLGDYEAGVYGLAEVMRDVKRLKKAARAGEDELQACLTKLNHRSQQMEDLLEENRWASFRCSAGSKAGRKPVDLIERVQSLLLSSWKGHFERNGLMRSGVRPQEPRKQMD